MTEHGATRAGIARRGGVCSIQPNGLCMVHFYEQVVLELRRNPRLALGIISGVKGSSPQKQGAKALFLPDDRLVGTLGGGCLEAEIRRRARLGHGSNDGKDWG